MAKRLRTPTAKPSDDDPLFPHCIGQRCHKLRARHHNFGPWNDADGHTQRTNNNGTTDSPVTNPAESSTITDLIDSLLGDKDRARESGEITEVTLHEYEATCDIIAEWDRRRKLQNISFTELPDLPVRPGQGTTKRHDW